MSLLEAINKRKSNLKPTVTSVIREDGSVTTEKRNTGGTFEVCDEDEPQEEPGVSKRRQKKVERAKRAGYVVDLKPDLQLAQCCSGIYLGSQDVARDYQILKSNGITHILNVATGIANFFHKNFRYCNIEILDLPSTELRQYFPTVLEFMHGACRNGGKVFVHCNAGISRSTSFVVAYMMKYHGYTSASALEEIRKVRPAARPNDGFMQELLKYEDDLKII